MSGDVSYANKVAYSCYRADVIEVITDKIGEEYVSGTQVYLPPNIALTVDDMLSFPTDLQPREIRKIGGFYDGNTGLLDIRVAYL